METVIYKITSPTNKVYIGQTRNWYKRQCDYKAAYFSGISNIHKSLLKYGWKNHKFEIVHNLPSDVSQTILNSYETIYWQLYKDCGVKMLNIKEPGTNGKMAEETKYKISKKLQGKKFSEETINRRLHTWKINGRSDKQKQQVKTLHKKRAENRGAIKVIDINTNQIFGCIKDAAEHLKIDASMLAHYLRGDYKNKTNIRYYEKA